jgi:5-oxoprolinase (ATP-hydrolysing) subunit A
MITNKFLIDFNADLGEGIPQELEIMPYLHSCNIACGGHFGDTETITATIKGALQHGLKIGAHPSYPDKENFGRFKMSISHQELYDNLLQQLFLFQSICQQHKVNIHHIKPHGALYNVAASNFEISELIVQIMIEHFPGVKLMGLPNSVTEKVAQMHAVDFIKEAFADRRYLDNGQLVPRSEEGAVLTDENQVLCQVSDIALHHKVKTITGNSIDIQADTICFHGDHPDALKIIKWVSTNLKPNDVN